MQHFLDEQLYARVAADPGKGDIIRLTDGARTLRYTKARRDRECRFLQHQEKTLDKKQHRCCFDLEIPIGDTILKAPTIEEIETMFLTTFNTKSCSRDRFVAYLEGRRLVAHHFRAEPGPGFAGNLAAFYRGAYFRSRKYSSYLAKKASEDKLVDRIRNTFGKSQSSQTSSIVNKAIVIFWGNWGQQPNSLRNNPSTPGIGLRRFIHRRLRNDVRNGITYFGTTLTTSERKIPASPAGSKTRNIQRLQRLWMCRRARCRSRREGKAQSASLCRRRLWEGLAPRRPRQSGREAWAAEAAAGLRPAPRRRPAPPQHSYAGQFLASLWGVPPMAGRLGANTQAPFRTNNSEPPKEELQAPWMARVLFPWRFTGHVSNSFPDDNCKHEFTLATTDVVELQRS